MGRAKTALKLLVLSCAVLVLVSSVGFSGAYFSDESSSETTQIVAGDFGPVDGDLKFTPKSLSTTNQGTTTVHASHPTESVIDPETVIVTVGGQPVDAPERTCNQQKCMFEPAAQDVVEAGGVGEPTLAVTGELENGSDFEASTTIDIFEPGGSDGPAHSSGETDGLDDTTTASERADNAVADSNAGLANGSTESESANQSEEPAADTETIDDGDTNASTIDDGDVNGSTSNATHDSDGDNRTQLDRETGEDSDTPGDGEDGGTAGEDLAGSGSSDDEGGTENASADEMSTVNQSTGPTESSAADDSSSADDGSTAEGNEPDEERAEENVDGETLEESEAESVD